MMSKRDYNRERAKAIRKIRWYYTHSLQEKKRRLLLYRSYRHYKIHNKSRNVSLSDCDFYMTKEVHPGAGIGDQLASWITGAYYARQFGIPYAYSRFYPDKWEAFLGFSDYEKKAQDLIKSEGYSKVILPSFDSEQEKDIELIKQIMLSYQGKRVVFFLELHQIYTEQIGMMEEIAYRFNRHHPIEKEKLLYRKGHFNIAVHIRRGDIEPGQITGEEGLTKRWLDNSYFINILRKIEKLVDVPKMDIYIFSQGKAEDFHEFAVFHNIYFCNTMPATDSFLHMCRADILLMSKSSFSYNPALISEGIRICPKDFWHNYPSENEWFIAEYDGSLPEKELDRLKKVLYNKGVKIK